jgi:hypothetical protein
MLLADSLRSNTNAIWAATLFAAPIQMKTSHPITRSNNKTSTELARPSGVFNRTSPSYLTTA